MSVTFHLVTGEYPPEAGGVGDYTAILAEELAARGCSVHVWVPGAGGQADREPEGGAAVSVHALPDRFGPRSREMLAQGLASAPGCLLLQYVPNALGMRGANLPFCFWIWRRRRTHDVRVMFHEPYFYFSWRRPLGNLLALAQRVMAALLLRAGSVVYLSTDTWRQYLQPFAPATEMIVLTIPATVPVDVDAAAVEGWRRRLRGAAPDMPVVGHFGTYGSDIAAPLLGWLVRLVHSDVNVRVALIGRGSESFAAALPADVRQCVVSCGALAAPDVAAALRACELVLQPYPDGVTTRRTSVMAALANGRPTVTTAGELTEPLWLQKGPVALIPVSDDGQLVPVVRGLLRNRAERDALGARARSVYMSEFAIGRTVDRLLRDRVASRIA